MSIATTALLLPFNERPTHFVMSNIVGVGTLTLIPAASRYQTWFIREWRISASGALCTITPNFVRRGTSEKESYYRSTSTYKFRCAIRRYAPLADKTPRTVAKIVSKYR